ncbi:MAG: aldehyde dehydrogenase [Candidatus Binatia bacterium]|nr:MAG: aldehyde dehydrogenase [Candidatus Binatia bacterium]
MVRSFDKLFIGGRWVEPSSAKVIEVVSPHTEEAIARVPAGEKADMDRAVEAARTAFDSGDWPRMRARERASYLERLLGLLQEHQEDLAQLISREMGSPISFSRLGQTLASNMVLEYYVHLSRTFAFEELREGMMGPVIVRREPVGVAACIVPWNVPLFTTMLKLAPALTAGATVVLKPAPETPLDALVLAEFIERAEFPPGVVNVVPADREVGEYLVCHPGVDKVAFTGSTAAGRRIAALCGERLKRCTLELGGKSAAIILDDAALEPTIAGLVPAVLMNNGQACVAQTRVLASKRRYDEVVQALVQAFESVPVGDPLDPATVVGPLVSARQRERVEGYIRVGREEGAQLACGGGRPKSLPRGWYVEPTVFARVHNSMRIAREEIFGPVVSVIPYETEEEAIRIANDSDYGLSGTVWTADVQHGVEVARQVRTGTYTVNGFALEFGAPFGGFKASGLGRELGPEGLMAYLEAKSISLPHGAHVELRN